MSQMSKHYEPEFKKKIVRLHLEEGRTLKGLAAEYGVSTTRLPRYKDHVYTDRLLTSSD